jgi:hypothetical protein
MSNFTVLVGNPFVLHCLVFTMWIRGLTGLDLLSIQLFPIQTISIFSIYTYIYIYIPYDTELISGEGG